LHKFQQKILIKGTKEGLTLYLNDDCSLQTLIDELSQLEFSDYPSPTNQYVPITVHVGKRYLHKEEKKQIESIIEEKGQLLVKSFHSDVMLKSEAEQLAIDHETTVIHKIVRSGQVLKEEGDILLIGDVNPGGIVQATGNIYVLGKLLGIAHAGITGNRKAIIVASYMNPSQLRIADFISRAPDYESAGVYMECGLIDQKENRIVLNRLQTLLHKNLNVTADSKGECKNG